VMPQQRRASGALHKAALCSVSREHVANQQRAHYDDVRHAGRPQSKANNKVHRRKFWQIGQRREDRETDRSE
jgi:hypothetical protein